MASDHAGEPACCRQRSQRLLILPLYVLDTDSATHFCAHHPHVMARAQAVPSSDLAVTVLTVEEQLNGWYTFLRRAASVQQIEMAYDELAETVRYYANKPVLGFPTSAIARYEALFNRKPSLNVRKYDLRIAAIALENNAIVVTANTRDFSRVPGLLIEDWTLPPGP